MNERSDAKGLFQALGHLVLHIYTLYPEADRENVLPLKPFPDLISLIQLCTLNLFTRAGRTFGSGGFFAIVLQYLKTALRLPSRSSAPSVEWLEALHKEDPDLARRSAGWARTMLLFHAAIIVTSILTGLWVLPLIITLGSFTTNIFSHAVGIAQHSGMKHRDPDFRKVARSMTLGPLPSTATQA